MNKGQQEIWQGILRAGAFAGVLFLWGLSVKWSAAGLQAKNPDDPDTTIIGYGLALFITVAQLIFNRGAINPTLFVVGLFAYLYGIGTNIVGIMETFQFDLTINALQTNPLGWIIDFAILGGLAFGIEVAPEAYLMWALNPKLQRPGDAISTFLGRKDIFKTQPTKQQFQSSFQPKPERPQPFPVHSERSTVPEQNRSVRSNDPVQNAVNAFISRFRSQNGGKMPSYADIVKNVSGISSKSQVKPFVETYNKQHKN